MQTQEQCVSNSEDQSLSSKPTLSFGGSTIHTGTINVINTFDINGSIPKCVKLFSCMAKED